MSFRVFLWMMIAASLLAWVGWIYVIFAVDPAEAGWAGLILFYVTLFAASIGTMTIGGVGYRHRIIQEHELMIRQVKIAFRHALMLSMIGVASLALSAHGWLQLWTVLLICLTVGLVEYAFLLVQESHRG